MNVQDLPPGSLRGYTDLETLARKHGAFVEDVLDVRVAAGQQLQDEGVELDYPVLMPYSAKLAQLACGPEPEPEQSNTVYRAMHFGIYLSMILVRPDPWGLRLNMEGIHEVGFDDYLSTVPGNYIGQRHRLDSLIARYLPTFTEGSGNDVVAEQVAGLTIMQVEDFRLTQFALNQSKLPGIDLDAWDGTFPDRT